MQKNGIEVKAVWLWIDNNRDAAFSLAKENEIVFNAIKEVGYKGQIWVGFNANFFENLPDSTAVKKVLK
ncbi:MAG: hypothetical protein HC798_00335 [Polaribacter sp.]|nr:hypothetical protein [Polaribacter sp.]